ncbi:MAG: glutaminase [Proteobacteria bacterium]|nr:glutaminase [Pseudomonadota bacterium]
MNLQAILDEIEREIQPHLGSGKVADYIPALARIDPTKFGIAVTTIDGDSYAAGDSAERFSIQSVSKVFTLTMAAELIDQELWKRVGREPSGSPFNSIVQLEYEHGIPRNPFINPGAVVITDIILSHEKSRDAKGAILAFLRELADDEAIGTNPEVAASEKEWGFRNAALANLMKAFGNIENAVDDVLDIYFNQCAIEMTCRQLSRAMLYLANQGTDPISGRVIVSPGRAKRINSIMLTCGHYDASGDFAVRVGLPGKSGVGGGIVAIVPQCLAIAVWSPALNEQGNSFAGTLALEKFAARTGYSIF